MKVAEAPAAMLALAEVGVRLKPGVPLLTTSLSSFEVLEWKLASPL